MSIDELIKEYERLQKGAGSTDMLNWMRKAYKLLKELRDKPTLDLWR